jgi:hypothetical protein
MATFNKFNQYQEDLHKGVHNFTSDGTCTLRVAFCANANAPVAGNSILADLTQISYTNCSTRDFTGVTCEQTAGVVHVTASDLTITASGGAIATFRHVVFYNDDPTSPADPLIGWATHTADISILDGESFLIDIPTDLFTSS